MFRIPSFGGGGGNAGNNGIPNIPIPPPNIPNNNNNNNNNNNDNNNKKKDDDDKKFQGFDPRGFERAAEASKELNKSKYVKEAIEMAKDSEKTKQMEYQAIIAERNAQAKQLELKRQQVMEEERRKTIEQEAYLQEKQARYQDKLQRDRMKEELAAKRSMQNDLVRKQEEATKRMEAEKRATLEKELSARRQAEIDRVRAETKGKIEHERANHHLHLEKLHAEAEENRTTVLEATKIAAQAIGDGLTNYLNDKEKITRTVIGLSCLALGVYTAKAGTTVVGNYIGARLGKPSLVRDTSKRTLLDFVKHPFKTTKEVLFKNKVGDALDGVILDKTLESRLKTVSTSTQNTKVNGAPYRNLLLYGHPGTGKTMFAKNLAQHSNLDYAIMTGGDVAPLGREGVTEMHKIFDWAQTSKKGLLLFVDEADAFLRKRTGADGEISEDMRNALNAFLYRTGEASTNFMVVFASNQPEQLDWAVQDRVDEIVEFTLPGLDERVALVKQYFDMYVKNPQPANQSMFGGSNAKKIEITGDFDVEDKLTEYAKKLKNFSGREISKLGIAWQASAYGSHKGELTEEMMDVVFEIALAQHTQKIDWR